MSEIYNKRGKCKAFGYYINIELGEKIAELAKQEGHRSASILVEKIFMSNIKKWEDKHGKLY